jgi:hypothetical protein
VPPSPIGEVVDLMIVLYGLGLLVALAVVIGKVDTGAQDAAWRRIGEARHDQHLRETALRRCLASPRCAQCPLNGYLGEG